MLALIVGIVAAAGWIAFDVWACVVTYPAMPTLTWWLFVVSGAALIALTIAAEVLGYKAANKAERRQAREHDVLAQGSIAVLAQLATVTKTTGQPAIEVIQTATARIEYLERDVRDLQSRTRHITSDQNIRFGRALPFVLSEQFTPTPDFTSYKGVRVIHGSTVEAKSYAEELFHLFGGYAITTTMVEEHSQEALNATGLTILIADLSQPTTNDQKTMKLLDAAGIVYKIMQETADLPLITTLRIGRAWP